MKKKISVYAICCALLASMLTGCANYDDITVSLDEVTIQNTLPKVSENASYDSLAEIDDLVYEQQLNACLMYYDAYTKTYYKQFEDGKRKPDKIAYMCTEKRKTIDTDIEVAYAINIYRLLQDIDDCSNPDAYVVKTHKDVLDFYDIYAEYENGDNPQDTLLKILVEYYERSNILAFTFLREQSEEVFDAALARIEENASVDKDFRVYVNENNIIISALNEVYGGVPDKYSRKISTLNTFLAKKLLMSLENITEDEREKLLRQLEPATPSPSPTIMPTSTPRPTPAPTIPPATRIPSAPIPTQRPTQKPTQRPTQQPTQQPVITQRPTTPTPYTPAPTEEPYEPVFGLDDPVETEPSNGMYEFQ